MLYSKGGDGYDFIEGGGILEWGVYLDMCYYDG
jgi:hypothetical protein